MGAFSIRRLRDEVRRFHDDEDGLAPLEVVMILALAAMAALALYMIGKKVIGWGNQNVGEFEEKATTKGMTEGLE